jgi:hypothetical protein
MGQANTLSASAILQCMICSSGKPPSTNHRLPNAGAQSNLPAGQCKNQPASQSIRSWQNHVGQNHGGGSLVILLIIILLIIILLIIILLTIFLPNPLRDGDSRHLALTNRPSPWNPKNSPRTAKTLA